jgi:hypothetical protein
VIDWTAEADALLIKLWGDGLSLALIADGLSAAGYHVSRNAVSGRRHRLSRSSFVPRSTQLRKPRVAMRPPRPRTKKVSLPKKPPAKIDGVEYFDARTGCKATLDRRGHLGLPLVCGEPLADDSRVYCLTHFQIFHHPHQGIRRAPDGQASQVPGNRNFRQGRP